MANEEEETNGTQEEPAPDRGPGQQTESPPESTSDADGASEEAPAEPAEAGEVSELIQHPE